MDTACKADIRDFRRGRLFVTFCGKEKVFIDPGLQPGRGVGAGCLPRLTLALTLCYPEVKPHVRG